MYEPFRKRTMRFRGVAVADLLAIAGASPTAQQVYTHALDDYHVDFTRTELEQAGAVLATRADGRAIPLEQGGPARIVFSGKTRLSANSDNWIWSVDWIRIRP